jgi:TATA-binding protein-associated factor Taf7
MPAKSKSQQKAAGAALAAKRGEAKKRDLQGASEEMYESMDEDQLRDLAKTKRKGKPDKVSDD